MCTNLHLPSGIYKSRASCIAFNNDISETDEENTILVLGKDKCEGWIYGLDILPSVHNPLLVFSALIIQFGSLVFANAD